MVSYNKMSKKAQKAINNERRNTWDISPVTKVVKSKKVYDRKKAKRVEY